MTHRRLVALALPAGEEFLSALDAAWARGDAVLPVDPEAPPAAVDRLLTAMQPDLPVDDDVALVIATSGSTGTPKGAQLSQAALEASARAAYARFGVEAGDSWLSCLPWHHIGGIQVMIRARMLDLPLSMHDRFDIDRIAAGSETLTAMVPTQLVRLLDAGVDLARFRVILLGGAAAPADLVARARAAGAPIITTYGMSETSGGCVYDGLPLDGVTVRIGADGRIQLRGPMLMNGYRLRPDLDHETFSDGWLVTSDLGVIEADGRLRVTGRADDVVISGGENVLASRVAEVLSRHPAFADVTVTGVPHEQWGQVVVAVVALRDASVGPTLAEVRAWSADELPAAWRPRGLVVVDAIPTLRTGKPDRLAVAQIARKWSGDSGD